MSAPTVLLHAVERPDGWHWLTTTRAGVPLIWDHQPFASAAQAFGNAEYIDRRAQREGRDLYQGDTL